MTTISIREQGTTTVQPVVSIDGQEYPITISNPFSEQEERRLEWYFEEHLRFPFVDQVQAAEAAQSIVVYGEALFAQVFADPMVRARYLMALQQGLETITIEIAGSPAFHALHWEALKDPEMTQPLALQVTFVRKNLRPQMVQAAAYGHQRPSPTINLLVVTARPGGAHDVSYRTISRPLVESLRQAAVPVNIEILRPGTYEALVQHLETVRQNRGQDAHGTGYYHVIHFDVHGALLTYDEYLALEEALPISAYTFEQFGPPSGRYGRATIAPYEGEKGFLFLDHAESSGEKGQRGTPDPVEASELAELLKTHQIPVAILNACQSGKERGQKRETGVSGANIIETTETSLGSQLMQAGMQMVLAMAYSVTVSAAEIVMGQLYTQLFAKQDLTTAIRRARLELHNRKARRAYFDQTIALEDWLLPVVYQNQPLTLQPRDFTQDERVAFYTQQAMRYRAPTPTYDFVGRDLDILYLEKRLLTQGNVLLLRGMGGAGKTTLLHHLGEWWQTTGFVEQVFYFGYDSKAWTRQQIMDSIGRQLLGETNYIAHLQPLDGDIQQEALAAQLRAHRHLLILDNLESITGAHLAIQHTLTATEQARLHRFVQALTGGKTLVLLGSRGQEDWLKTGTFGERVYELPGLDPQAASQLADRILVRHNATAYRDNADDERDLQRLIKLLDGYPLALEVVLANLARQKPSAVLAALAAGDVDLDNPDAQAKTESILKCIDYSHSNLSTEAQALLLCLAPFVGVINQDWLPRYTAQLQSQTALAHLPFAHWDAVLQEAINWGLLTSDDRIPGYVRIQPIFPYFLRNRLQDQADLRSTIETAFYQRYSRIGQALHQLLTSKQPQEKQAGRLFAQMEFENLHHALQVALAMDAVIEHVYKPLDRFLDTMQDHQRGVALGESILAAWGMRPAETLDDDQRFDLLRVLSDLGQRQMTLQHYADAQAAYEQSLSLIDSFVTRSERQKALWKATIYHQLGVVAEAQRVWAQAEQHFQQTLQIYIEFDDRYSQASTYHQLGIVAEAQRV
ncbi:MAG: CHAT domain-containing protein, partial [Chloroflexota bacterium]